MNILILEDDADLCAFIGNGLQELGHLVSAVDNGLEAVRSLAEAKFDVAVVDRLVPGLDGLSVVRQARQSGCQTPILLLTALGSIEDRVIGLEGGADDYLVKPFAFVELVARLNALARRPPAVDSGTALRVADIEMDLLRRKVHRAGKDVELQAREFKLLEYLMRNAGKVVTRTMLLDRVWNLSFDPRTNIVETHMSRLRSKLGQGFSTNPIKTVRGAGYMMDDDEA